MTSTKTFANLDTPTRQFVDDTFDAIDDITRARRGMARQSRDRLVRAIREHDIAYISPVAPEQVTLTDEQWAELEQIARLHGSSAIVEDEL